MMKAVQVCMHQCTVHSDCICWRWAFLENELSLQSPGSLPVPPVCGSKGDPFLREAHFSGLKAVAVTLPQGRKRQLATMNDLSRPLQCNRCVFTFKHCQARSSVPLPAAQPSPTGFKCCFFKAAIAFPRPRHGKQHCWVLLSINASDFLWEFS